MSREPKIRYAPKSADGERRWCNKCGRMMLVPDEIKPLGRRCFACQAETKDEYWKSYYAENRQKQLDYQAAYREAHREEINAYQREYAARHREEAREKARQWYYANRERHKARTAAYRQANPERQAEWVRRWYANKLRTKAGRLSYLEDSRMRSRLNAERNGRELTPVPLDEYRERYGGDNHHVQVPLAPLLPYVKAAYEELGSVELARLAGTSDKRVMEMIRGDRDEISLPVADALCTHFELPFSWLYQDVA